MDEYRTYILLGIVGAVAVSIVDAGLILAGANPVFVVTAFLLISGAIAWRIGVEAVRDEQRRRR
jgi:hypothetical protein